VEEIVRVGLLVSSLHLRTALWGAELSDGAVEEVDLVVEVDDCHQMLAMLLAVAATDVTIDSQPLVLVLAFWKLYSLP
jgi:hypothetical protein